MRHYNAEIEAALDSAEQTAAAGKEPKLEIEMLPYSGGDAPAFDFDGELVATITNAAIGSSGAGVSINGDHDIFVGHQTSSNAYTTHYYGDAWTASMSSSGTLARLNVQAQTYNISFRYYYKLGGRLNYSVDGGAEQTVTAPGGNSTSKVLLGAAAFGDDVFVVTAYSGDYNAYIYHNGGMTSVSFPDSIIAANVGGQRALYTGVSVNAFNDALCLMVAIRWGTTGATLKAIPVYINNGAVTFGDAVDVSAGTQPSCAKYGDRFVFAYIVSSEIYQKTATGASLADALNNLSAGVASGTAANSFRMMNDANGNVLIAYSYYSSPTLSTYYKKVDAPEPTPDPDPFDDTDPTQFIDTLTMTETNGSPVVQLSGTLVNASPKMLRLFHPSARFALRFGMGNSAKEYLGVFYVDEVTYNAAAATMSFSARNSIGFLLMGGNYGTKITATGGLRDGIETLVDFANIENYTIDPALTNTSTSITFGGASLYDNITKDILSKYSVDGEPLIAIWERPNGEVLIGGNKWMKTNFNPAEVVTLNKGHIFMRSIKMGCDTNIAAVALVSSDASYTYKKEVPNNGWKVPRKIFSSTGYSASSQADLDAIGDGIVAEYQNYGITTSWNAPFNPRLTVGDIVDFTDNGETERAGLVTSVTHTMGRKGFSTAFTTDSGGVIDNEVTRTRSEYGYTSKQTIVDLVRKVAGK